LVWRNSLDKFAPSQVRYLTPFSFHPPLSVSLYYVIGIGKALQSFDLLGLVQLNSIIDCCKWMRDNHSEVSAYSEDTTSSNSSRSASSTNKPSSSRVEFLPVEWHEKFNRISRQNGPETGPGAGLDDIALKSIPHLRNFCNDAMLDVLYFMVPEHVSLLRMSG
jgi:hypothetical protein